MAVGWRKDYFRYKDFFLNILRIYRSKPDLKIYLELILSLIFIAVFSMFAIKPTILTIIELNKEIAGREETVSKLEKKVKDLQTASKILQDESGNLPLMAQAVPEGASPQTFIRQLEGQANASSIQLLSFSTSDIYLIGEKEEEKTSPKGSLPEGAQSLPFTLSLTGSYQNLEYFLKNMEILRRPVFFENISLNSTTSEAGKIITMLISGKVPYVK